MVPRPAGLLAAFLGAVAASNAIDRRAEPTAPWVTVDQHGQPSMTFTPTPTVIGGQPTILSGAPFPLTATVFTFTSYGELITSTGSPPPPTATATSGAGSFPKCFNMTSGDSAPVCDPVWGSILNPGNTYYITWDPNGAFFSNTALNYSISAVEVQIRVEYINATTDEVAGTAWDSPDGVPAGWGFYPWTVPSSILAAPYGDGANVSIVLRAGPASNRGRTETVGQRVIVAYPQPYRPTPTPAPTGLALYVGVPLVVTFVVVCLLVLVYVNRKHRVIGLRNIMSRSRRGFGGTYRRLPRERGKKGSVLSGQGPNGGTGRYRDEVDPGWEMADVEGSRRELGVQDVKDRGQAL